MSLITLNLGIKTRLDAVNHVLAGIESVGLDSEDEIENDVDASTASSFIDNMSQQIQTNNGKGWWFNRESFHKLVPNPTNGEVVIPNNTLSCYVDRGRENVKAVALRGNKLFDPDEYGYDMRGLTNGAGELPCVLVVNVPFEDTPSTVRQAIADFARFWMVSSVEGDVNKMRPMQEAAEKAMIGVQSEDASQRKRNMFNNAGIAYAVVKSGGYNNN